MPAYHVSYDLNGPGQNYEGLIKEIKNSPDWCGVCDSTWLVATNESAAALMTRLGKAVDDNDTVIVTQIYGQSWSGRISETVANWLRRY